MSFTKNTTWIAVTAVSLLGTGLATPAETYALTLTATSQCSATPPAALYPTRVINGDCQIKQVIPTQNPIVGNGIDEATFWDFDFTQDPNYSLFSAFAQAGNVLTSAVLSLEIIPKTSLVATDLLGIVDVQSNLLSEYTSLPGTLNQPFTFTQDLLSLPLNPYQPQSILASLFSGQNGKIPFRYDDDAIVVSSTLSLTIDESIAPVPEPTSTLGYLLLGLGGIGTLCNRQKMAKNA